MGVLKSFPEVRPVAVIFSHYAVRYLLFLQCRQTHWESMTRFRPCIDLHAGHVKQIVGGTLDAANASSLQTNHVSELPASHFAKLYRDRSLSGAHVIMLGPGNETAAKEALAAWPGGLQVGGGITAENAARWVELGAEKVGQQSTRED